MKEHCRFEFIWKNGAAYCADSLEDVFNELPVSLTQGVTLKSRAGHALEELGIKAYLPDLADGREEFIKSFFLVLQKNGIGSWKWYDSLIGELWRFDAARNDLVQRTKRSRKLSDATKAMLSARIKEAQKKRMEDPDKVHRVAVDCGKNRWADRTSQEVEDHIKKMNARRREWFASLTPEEKEARKKAHSEKMKQVHAEKRKLKKEQES